MKRLLIAGLVLLLLGIAAVGETGVDLNQMDLQDLYALREAVNARIAIVERQSGQAVYPSGTYKVGRDLPEGDYVFKEAADAMFSSVIVRRDSSESSDLVSHHLINGQCVGRLRAGTWVTLSEATACPIHQASAVEISQITDGGYLVGVTLPEGTYRIAPADNAPLSSYSIYDGILGTDAQLQKFEVILEPTTLTLAAGEYVELSGCALSLS